MDRRTVSLGDGSLRFRYFGKFQCGIAIFYYFLCNFAVFGPSLRPPHSIPWCLVQLPSESVKVKNPVHGEVVLISAWNTSFRFCDVRHFVLKKHAH